MKAEELYNWDINSLQDFLLKNKEDAKEILKDIHIKEKLIAPNNKYEFIWFVQGADNLLLYLLDNIGIKILEISDSFETKIAGLLTSNNPWLPLLFQNKNFCELVVNNLKRLSSYLKALKSETALVLMNYLHSDIKTLNKIVLFFNQDTSLEVVKQIELELKTKLKLIKKYKKVAEYLLNNDPTITTLSIFSISDLYNIVQKDIQLSPILLKEKDFLKQITNTPHTKEYRFIINSISKSNDVSHIETKRKKFYDSEIKSYIKDEGMLKNYYECYKYMVSLDLGDYDFYPKIKEGLITYLKMDSSTNEFLDIASKIFEILNTENENSLKEFFQNESNIQLSNMIIDYHFEEISYNLFINLRQLLSFQETEGKTLNSNDIETYTKILNLDTLSYEEKLLLHEKLKSTDFIEKYYDDIRNAKNSSIELIKEKMLTKESIQKYKNEELSKKYGINVYILDKDPFFVLVKALGITKTSFMETDTISYTVDGASYSLDSSSKLNTFADPKHYYNIAYTDFEINQVVHIYPTDSYSYYVREGTTPATERVWILNTPESLCAECDQYNEIIIAQKNNKNDDELNNDLKVPQMFAIYCYDMITHVDVISARNLGLGIILVKTKSYKNKTTISKKSIYDTITEGYKDEINYLDEFTQDDKYNRRK